MNLEQWSVGGRAFSGRLVFVLMAGELYTTFTFLGASGFAYGHGGPAFYVMAYSCLAFGCCRTGCCRPSGASPGSTACSHSQSSSRRPTTAR